MFASFTSGKSFKKYIFKTCYWCHIFVASPRYRRQHDSSSSLIEHRHSMSICESSNSSDSSSSKTSSLSPELRMRPKSHSTEDKSQAHLSCPDLETMVTRSGGNHPMTIPNRAIESHKSADEAAVPSSSPVLNRKLPKFSISMEDPRPKIGLSRSHNTEGPRSLPVTPKVSVEPNTPSPLVICSGGAKPKISPSSANMNSSTTKMVSRIQRLKISELFKDLLSF